MVFDKMSAIILKGEGIKPGSPHEGAIKYNALLVMTELTDNDGGKPKPSADAFKFLFNKILKGNTKDYMKAAALIGIERDAAARAIPKDAVPELTKTLLDLVNQKEPPAGRDAAAHQYLSRSAAQVLAAMGSPGPDYSVAKTFESLAADPKLRPTFRCEMAQFIGQLKYPKAAEAEVQRLATCIARQTLSICRQELDNAKAGNRAPSRQLLIYALARALDGLAGLQPSVKDTPTYKYIVAVTGKLKPIISEIEGKEVLDDITATAVSGKITDVEGILQDKSPPQTATTRHNSGLSCFRRSSPDEHSLGRISRQGNLNPLH